MLRKSRNQIASRLRTQASAFAALGDETRLALIVKLADGQPHSISRLTRGTRLTRQAVTKHLRVLESAGMVHSAREGRESLFEFSPQPILGLREYIDLVSGEWDQALARLKSLVER
ncbi:MAG TPA: metalloregulator ArsR/SmtB family transcription factor [Terriglobales bacterium]|nr:metalloregulator ArsR/SmtB family transcription factor [Terriglobales bacterium]